MIDYNLALTICAGILMAGAIKFLLSLVLNKVPLFGSSSVSGGSRSKDMDSVFSKSSGKPFQFDVRQGELTHSFAIGKTKDGMSFK